MIGKITGIVDYIGEDHVLIETAGVGYILYAAPGTLATLPEPGSVASLYTELLVREDLLQLIGFRTLAEREWHRLLTTVQGVGAKASLSILDTLGPEGVSRAIALGDTCDPLGPGRRAQAGGPHRQRVGRQSTGRDGAGRTCQPAGNAAHRRHAAGCSRGRTD
jgi:holliday junction DNA helicase RuvA